MISLKQASELVLQQAHSFGRVTKQLDESVGYALCQPIIADRDYPPFNRSTMDGIAINSLDWKAGIRNFKWVETIFAGNLPQHKIKKAECYKIMTGAAVPPDADTVIRKEDLEITANNDVTVRATEIKTGQFIARKGSDIKQGAAIINKAQLILPGTITMLASLGYTQVSTEKIPSVAIITTGDEVAAIDAVITDTQIRNSNAHLLKALLQQWKIKPVHCEHVKDDPALLLGAVKSQFHQDIILLSGAVSAGDADFVPEVLRMAAVQKIFHQVAIRPGKPIWFGVAEKGPVVFALPGNPLSTFVTFKLFIEPFFAACFGLPTPRKFYLPFSGNRIKHHQLDEFFPVKFSGNPTAASPITFNSSGDITAVMAADGLAWQAADKSELTNEDIVACMLL